MSRRRAPFLSGIALVVVLVVGLPTAALAAYISSGLATASASAATLPAPGKPVATDSLSGVTVTWSGTALSTGRAVDGYQLKRTVGSTTTTVCSTTTALTCSDTRQSANATYTVVAKVGNWSSTSAASATFVSDFAAPTSTLSVTPTANALGWVQSTNPSFSLSATDTGGSGVASVSYKINGGSVVTVAGSSTTFSSTLQGNVSVEYWATDGVGNAETHHTTAFKIDGSVAPAANFALSSDTGSSSTDLVTKTASQTFSGTAEANTAVKVVYGTQTKTTTASSTGAWSVSLTLDEGLKTATVTVTDQAGNVSTATPQLRLDTVAPTSAIETPVSGTTYTDSTWDDTCSTRGGPGICGTSADTNGSGVDTVTYELRKSGLLGGNYQCWNGNGWSAATCGTQTGVDSSTMSPWWTSVPTNSMPNGFILSIQMRLVLTVTDLAGNSTTTTISFAKY